MTRKKMTVAQVKKSQFISPADLEGRSYMCKLNGVRETADALLKQEYITKSVHTRLYDYAKTVADAGFR